MRRRGLLYRMCQHRLVTNRTLHTWCMLVIRRGPSVGCSPISLLSSLRIVKKAIIV